MDPLGRFPFRIEWKGRTVAGFRRMSELEPRPARAAPREGAIERLEPSRHAGVTFERGLCPDPAFAKWAASSQEPEDLVVRRYDEEGRPGRAYRIARCVVANFEAGPPSGPDVAIVRMGLRNEGWKRI